MRPEGELEKSGAASRCEARRKKNALRAGPNQDLHYDKAHGEETIPDETVRSLKSRVEEVTDLHPHLMELSARFNFSHVVSQPDHPTVPLNFSDNLIGL